MISELFLILHDYLKVTYLFTFSGYYHG